MGTAPSQHVVKHNVKVLELDAIVLCSVKVETVKLPRSSLHFSCRLLEQLKLIFPGMHVNLRPPSSRDWM